MLQKINFWVYLKRLNTKDRFNWLKSRNDEYFAIVIEEKETRRVVG